jgi:hypothetical protein
MRHPAGCRQTPMRQLVLTIVGMVLVTVGTVVAGSRADAQDLGVTSTSESASVPVSASESSTSETSPVPASEPVSSDSAPSETVADEGPDSATSDTGSESTPTEPEATESPTSDGSSDASAPVTEPVVSSDPGPIPVEDPAPDPTPQPPPNSLLEPAPESSTPIGTSLPPDQVSQPAPHPDPQSMPDSSSEPVSEPVPAAEEAPPDSVPAPEQGSAPNDGNPIPVPVENASTKAIPERSTPTALGSNPASMPARETAHASPASPQDPLASERDALESKAPEYISTRPSPEQIPDVLISKLSLEAPLGENTGLSEPNGAESPVIRTSRSSYHVAEHAASGFQKAIATLLGSVPAQAAGLAGWVGKVANGVADSVANGIAKAAGWLLDSVPQRPADTSPLPAQIPLAPPPAPVPAGGLFFSASFSSGGPHPSASNHGGPTQVQFGILNPFSFAPSQGDGRVWLSREGLTPTSLARPPNDRPG